MEGEKDTKWSPPPVDEGDMLAFLEDR